MTAATWLRRGGLAALLGCIYPFAIAQLFLLAAGWITVSLVQGTIAAGFAQDTVHFVVRVVNAVVWAAIIGMVFGVPLGLGVRKNVLVYWLIFVVAYFLITVAEVVWSNVWPGILFLVWTLPDTWLSIVAVLGFAHISAQFLAHRARDHAPAP